MADLRINGWSDESLKCQPDLDQKFYLTLAGKSRFWYQNIGGFGSKVLFDTSGEESILVSEHRGLWDQALCPF